MTSIRPAFAFAPVFPGPTIPVLGRAASPNAFSPALPCTLFLSPPGDLLLAPGLSVTAAPRAVPTTNGDFDYLPFGVDDLRFDQVNVMYHAQRFLGRLQRYGLELAELPIRVNIQVGIGSFSGVIEPASTIGTGLGGRFADTKDADIIVHELTHAVFNPRMPTEAYPLDRGEAQPVAEGIADYFAAVVQGDTRIGEYSAPPAGYHDIQSTAAEYNYLRWDLLPADPYSKGRIINGALLDLRAQIGELADELAFAAVETHPLRCMTCYADAVRWADAERYGGAHLGIIEDVFRSRGLGSGPVSNLAVLGPAWAWSTDPVRYELRHRCGPGPFTFSWAFRPASGGLVPLESTTDTVTCILASTGVLEASITDRLGHTDVVSSPLINVYAGDQPGLRLPGIVILGPTALPAGTIGDFGYLLTGGTGILPAQLHWRVQNGVIIRGRDNAATIGAQSRGGTMIVEMTYTDAVGQTVTATKTVVTGTAMSVAIRGPGELGPAQQGRFQADVLGGVGPYLVEWGQLTAEGETPLGAGPEIWSRGSGTDFIIIMRVYDTTGNFVREVRPVHILPTVAGQDAPRARVFRTLGTRVNRGGRLAFELPDGSAGATLELMDLAGRVLARDHVGASSPARHEMSVPASAEAGMYFARLVTPYGVRVARFVVLPS
ncbi:MAG: hypothetical protein ABL977_00200 [Candidatus Eisenbacteria bacterium]